MDKHTEYLSSYRSLRKFLEEDRHEIRKYDVISESAATRNYYLSVRGHGEEILVFGIPRGILRYAQANLIMYVLNDFSPDVKNPVVWDNCYSLGNKSAIINVLNMAERQDKIRNLL